MILSMNNGSTNVRGIGAYWPYPASSGPIQNSNYIGSGIATLTQNSINNFPAATLTGGLIRQETYVDIPEDDPFETYRYTSKTIFVVLKPKLAFLSKSLLVSTKGLNLYSSVNGTQWGTKFANGYISSNNSLTLNTPVIIGVISSDGINYQFRKNGQLIKQGSDGGGFATYTDNEQYYFGNTSDGSQPANSDISEIIIYNRALDNQELSDIEHYLNKKYKIY